MTDTLELTAPASCLALDGDLLYIGEDSGLRVFDLRTFAERKCWPTRKRVGALVIAGTTVYGAIGAGGIAAWADRALTSEAALLEDLDMNVLKLASAGDTLYWGTYWGEVWQYPQIPVASLRKDMTAIAADARYVYVGYRDGKLRVHSRNTKKRVQILAVPGRGGVKVVVATDVLFTVNSWVGTFTRWRNFVAEKTWNVDLEGAAFGMLGLRTSGSWIVYHTADKVCVHDFEGALVGTWRPPKREDTRILDVLVDGETLFVAVENRVERIAKSALS